MAAKDYNKMTRQELYELAQIQKVKKRSTMSKKQLIEALSKLDREKQRSRPLKKGVKKIAKKKVKKSVSKKATPSKGVKKGAAKKAAAKPVSAKRVARKPGRKTISKTKKREFAPQAAPFQPPQPVQTAQEPYIDRGHPLPLSYGEDKLIALVRDPHWIFVYWELEGNRKENVLKELGKSENAVCEWALRVQNLTRKTFKDVPIFLESYNWYLHVDEDCDHQVTLGLYDDNGEFISVVSSNIVRTPSSRLSNVIDEKWMLVGEAYNQLVKYVEDLGAMTYAAGRKIVTKIIKERFRLQGMHSKR